MRRAVLLLAWWFATAHAVIGPFDNEQSCQTIRASMSSSSKSTCWYEGGR